MNMDKYLCSSIQTLDLKKEAYIAPILDIGGGGEGVIGQIYGKDVIAIDKRKDELEETNNEATKIVMDATELQFLDNSFSNATSFFTLMYMPHNVRLKALKEVYRVLKKGGILDIWETPLPAYDGGSKTIYVFKLKYIVNGKETETGYGCKMPQQAITKEYYIEMLNDIGFNVEIVFNEAEMFRLRCVK